MRPTRQEARLSRRSLGDQIADQLRQEILLGQLPPDTTVSQQWLCEAYGTSRMPVRDALVKLTNEGLLLSGSGGQATVVRLTRDDLLDAFDIEALVHARAARRAAVSATSEDIDHLQELHQAMLEAKDNDELDRIGDLNWSFHRAINKLACSPKLVAIMRTVSLDVPRNYLRRLPDWAERATAEHAEIVEAFRERDAEHAGVLMQKHLERAGSNLVHYLEDNGLLGESSEQSSSTPTAG